MPFTWPPRSVFDKDHLDAKPFQNSGVKAESTGGAAMPGLIFFILTRLSIGFAIGCAAGFAIWRSGFSDMGAGLGSLEHLVIEGLFIYLFASAIGMGYLATALLLDEG